MKVLGISPAPAEHALSYIVEAEDYNRVVEFLLPGFKRCQSRITPMAASLSE